MEPVLRTLLLALALTAAPLGALAAMDGQNPATSSLFSTSTSAPAPGGPVSGVQVSQDARTVVVDHRALPGSQGWFVLPVAAKASTAVVVKVWVNVTESADQIKGHAILIDEPGSRGPLILENLHGHRSTAAIAHNGTAVHCCGLAAQALTPQYVDGPQGWEVPLHLGPDEPLHVAVAADGWGDGDDLRIQITASDAELSPGELATGTATHVVDLRQAAYDEGTSARFGGNHLAGEPGEARLELDIEQGGLALVESWVSGNATARIELALPNGTTVDNGNGQQVVLFAQALTGPGPLSVSLTDLDEGATWPRGEHADWGWVDALVLVSEMPLASTELAVHTGHLVEDDDAPLPEENTITVDDGHMPGETGWFLVPITVDEDTEVQVRYQLHTNATGEDPTGFAPLVLPPEHAVHYLWGSVLTGGTAATASAQGHAVSCCPLPGNVSFSSASGSGQMGFFLEAGETLYVGLAADGWSEASSFELKAHAVDTSPGVGQPLTGTNVRAVDLVQEAYQQGASARLFAGDPQGVPGQGQVSFAAAHTGLVLAEYWIEGDARGVLEVELPDGTTVDNGDGRQVVGSITALTDPGPVQLTLSDVERDPPLPGAAGGERSNLHVRALLVDLLVPHRGLDHQEHATRGDYGGRAPGT